ncbi:MAG: DUF6048 family protein [Flavobacteriaceae bacterium]|jgi:hypothetical protein|nr:DUF6048 family protein [Flavobacteriaceae bacterium]MDG2314245.1 DUF6048 family protein [Flavobacteriaceae bacterium]
MSKYIISSFLLFTIAVTWGQENTDVINDSIVYKERYGLRVGVDVSKPIRSILEENYSGLELLADYRISKRLYIAGEIGNEKKSITENNVAFTTKGSYFKLGVDLNTYRNWVGMENMIYVGIRYGLSKHEQRLHSYSIYNTSQYWEESVISEGGENGNFTGLSGQWIEFQFGVKAELLRNLYMGVNLQLKRLISEERPENFDNLYIPGFNKVLDDNTIGVGLSYSIMYQIPLYTRTK